MENRDKPFRMAKTMLPRIQRIHPRKRLLRWLREREALTAIWISAPAGAGKTTLVADYLTRRKRRHLWLQLDAGDADPATFFHYLYQAADHPPPPAPRLSPGHQARLQTYIRHHFKAIVQHVGTSATLVFDNFQELPADTPLHALLKEILKEMPPGIQIIFLSRNAPPPWFASLEAGNRAAHLDWEALRLTEEESLGIARLFESSDRYRHPEPLIVSLHHQTRGWAAGLILMLQAIENRPVAPDTIEGQARETIFNYFASELFDKAEPEEQSFLLESALLPQMPLPCVRELTGHPRAEAIFRHLLKRNCFVTYRAGAHPVYEYHPLFREFLLARGSSTWGPGRLNALRRKAARILFRTGHPEQAIELWLTTGAWPEAARAIVHRAPVLVAQGRLRTLGQWLNQLPPSSTASFGWICYWAAMCQTDQQERKALSLFDKAFSRFEKEKSVAGMYLCIADALRLSWMNPDNHEALDRWLHRFEKLYPHQNIPRWTIEAKVIANVLMGLYFRKPAHRLVPALMKRAEQLWHSRLDLNLRWLPGFAICPFLIGQGKLLHWMENFGIFEPKREDDPLVPEVHLSILMAIAHGELLRGHAGNCNRHVERGLALAEKSGFPLLDNWLLGLGAAGALLQADMASADHYLERMNARLASRPPNLDTALYQLIMSWRAMLLPDPPQAKELAQAALETALSAGSPYPVALCRYVLAHALFIAGEQSRAFQLLDRAVIRWTDGLPHQQLLFYCIFSKACFLLQRGNREAAAKLLRKALPRGESQGFGLPLWIPPDLVEPVLCLALEQAIEIRYVQHLIQLTGITPRNPLTVPPQWPIPIRVFTLGRFLLQLKGKNLPATARHTKNRPLEMLKAIIAFGGEDVAQEKVMDALWPDADGDTAVKSLHTTLHRLRKLLGVEEAVILKDGYLSLDPHLVWVDIRCLDRLLDRIGRELASGKARPASISALIDAAERLFQGPFLGSETARPWSIAPAERLRNRLIRTILSLGRYWEEKGMWERAADCYRCGIQLDPLGEVFYRHLMYACFKMGNHAEALTTYEHCRQVLTSSLGILPGERTVRLYQTILAAAQPASSADGAS